jgi:hypothetical protein
LAGMSVPRCSQPRWSAILLRCRGRANGRLSCSKTRVGCVSAEGTLYRGEFVEEGAGRTVRGETLGHSEVILGAEMV